jgi:N-acyl homoserine lactone hydrolase
LTNVIKPIVLGEIESDKSTFTYMCFAGEKIKVDIPIFYIEGPKENILVDTGSYKDLMAKYWPGRGKDFQDFDEGLDSVGLSPKDIDIVIYTHLHHDHCGYHSKIPNAKAIVQEDEWLFAMAPHPLQAQFYPRDLYENMDVMLVKGDYQVTEGVKILWTPGHTPGTQSVAIETKRGLAIIAGFCSIYDTFETPKNILPKEYRITYGHWEVFAPNIATNLLQIYNSALRVKKMANLVIPNHGPGLANIKEIP